MPQIKFNPIEIKSQAKDIIRMASNDHPQTNNYLSRYVENFKENACFSELQLVRAKWDSFKKEENSLYKNEISPFEFLSKIKKIKQSVDYLEKTEPAKELRLKMAEQHPKTWMHRWAILNMLQERFHESGKLPLTETAPDNYFSHLKTVYNGKRSKKFSLRVIKFFNKAL